MDSTALAVDTWIGIVDLAGVLANAILGGIAARAARTDIIGFVILAILSGLGGGIIRDTMLQQGPPVAFIDPFYLPAAILGAVIAFFVAFRSTASQCGLVLLDALGRRLDVLTAPITGEAREAAWSRIEAQWPGYRAYERDSGRTVRLFLLRPVRELR